MPSIVAPAMPPAKKGNPVTRGLVRLFVRMAKATVAENVSTQNPMPNTAEPAALLVKRMNNVKKAHVLLLVGRMSYFVMVHVSTPIKDGMALLGL